MIIEQIPMAQVARWWPQVERLFMRVTVKRLFGPTTDEVLLRIMRGDWQLWIARSEIRIAAALVTGITQERDGTKCLRLEQLAGDGMDWLSNLELIFAWGRQRGCTRWYIPHARRGWLRKLRLGRIESVAIGDAL